MGFLSGGSKGGGTTQTSSTVNTNMGPWFDQQPYLKDVFGAASNQYHANPSMSYFPDSTVSPFNPAQTQGLNATANMGTSPLIPASVGNATDTLNGKYLDPSSNPWLNKTFNTAADQVGRQFQNITAPTTDSLFAANGRTDSGARYNAQHNNDMGLGTTLDNLATGIYGGNYQAERGHQMQTQALAPQIEQSRYIDPTAQVNAGGAMQAQDQKQLSDKVNRFNFNQTSPWQTLGLYKSMIDGSYGQSGTTTGTQQTPYSSNPFGSIFGGLLGAAGTAGQLGWSPFSPGGMFGASAGGAGMGGGLSSLLPMMAMA